MQCSDLERNLEAFLDGRLGRSRSTVLRRHLGGCVACRVRLEKLRHFERDANRRLRIGEPVKSVWAGLDVDLVRSAHAPLPAANLPLRLLPSPINETRPVRPADEIRAKPVAGPLSGKRARGRRLAPRAVGVVLIVAAAGALVQSTRFLFVQSSQDGGELAIYLADFTGGERLPLETGDPAQLRDWLASQTGIAYPAPPAPDGLQLKGGRVDRQGSSSAAVIAYAAAQGATVLQVTPSADELSVGYPDGGCAATASGVNELRWHIGDFDYRALGTLPMPQLMNLAPQPITAACP